VVDDDDRDDDARCAPLVLLYGRVLRHHDGERAASANIASPMVLAAGYLTVWLGFSVIAAALQRIMEPGGLMSSMMLWSRSAALSAIVLAAAGVYQLSPFKRACLQRCRAPIQFLTSHWKPGRVGAFVMGLRHGAWCVGCCWILMGLLFVGGLMNLAWIAVLTLLVLAEKLAPAGLKVSRVSGVLLLAWSAATLAV
jgi:predicted metal-binding membrane protein